MFGIGMPELIVIFVVALVVLGPDKLPEIARSLGKGLSALKKATEDIKGDIMDAADEPKPTPIKSSPSESEQKEAWFKPIEERTEKDMEQKSETPGRGATV